MEAWDPGIEVTWELARRAMKRCAAGGIALSLVPMTSHDGMVCQAAAVAGWAAVPRRRVNGTDRTAAHQAATAGALAASRIRPTSSSGWDIPATCDAPAISTVRREPAARP